MASLAKNARPRWIQGLLGLLLLAVGIAQATLAAEPAATPKPNELVVVVMDPLAAPLSCPCVKGYAQRDYEKLTAYLESRLKRPVSVVFTDSLTAALDKKTVVRADVIIGKRSVVEFDAKAVALTVLPVASLSGKDGITTQTGLLVVPTADPAKTAADLSGYRIIFGTQECDEKYAAAMTLLKAHKVPLPAKIETSPACSDGATLILEAGEKVRGVAVISSYAKPLLEGCGTINKGDLRVVGETAPVPFITAFVASHVSDADRKAITDELFKVGTDPALCKSLETKSGFLPLAAAGPEVAKKK